MLLQSEEAPEMPGLKFLPCQRRWNSRGLQVVTVSQRWQLKGHWELQFHLLILAFLKVSLRQDKYFLKTCLCYLLRRNHTVYTTATSKEKSIAQQCRFQTLWSQHGPAGAALALLALLRVSTGLCLCWLRADTALSQAPLCVGTLLCGKGWNRPLTQQNLNFS